MVALIKNGNMPAFISNWDQCKFIFFNDIRGISSFGRQIIYSTGSGVKKILIENHILESGYHLCLREELNAFELLSRLRRLYK